MGSSSSGEGLNQCPVRGVSIASSHVPCSMRVAVGSVLVWFGVRRAVPLPTAWSLHPEPRSRSLWAPQRTCFYTLKKTKTPFYFKIILNLQKNCKNSTIDFHNVLSPDLPVFNILLCLLSLFLSLSPHPCYIIIYNYIIYIIFIIPNHLRVDYIYYTPLPLQHIFLMNKNILLCSPT